MVLWMQCILLFAMKALNFLSFFLFWFWWFFCLWLCHSIVILCATALTGMHPSSHSPMLRSKCFVITHSWLWRINSLSLSLSVSLSDVIIILCWQIHGAVVSATEVASMHDLEPGSYLVVPCTWKPDVEIKFLLRIFTETETSCGYVDVYRLISVLDVRS